MWLKQGLKSVLGVLGKSEKKVAAVFAISPQPGHDAVVHLKAGAPDVPIWLFAHAEPLPETKDLCERVYVNRSSLRLFLDAQIRLWPYCVAIAVGTWTAEHGHWLLKAAPFFTQPFRVLLLNSWGGFFSGGHVGVHWYRILIGAALSGWVRITELAIGSWRSGPVRRTRDITAACWLLVSHHIWRSGPVRRVSDVAMGAGLFVLARIMTWFAYPHRGWFARMHGSRFLEIEAGSIGNGFASFVQNGPAWDAARFRTLVESSNSRWIHWQEGGAADSFEFESVATLFGDPRTFAVARQSEAQGWKQSILPMAPFRHLQAGTTSQVLAPVSSSIWVDRAKLAALGIPAAKLTHTAWMLLFWQAAAAGWRCYSQPSGEAGKMQADLPAQEAEFFLRVYAEPELLRLGPAEPNLTRGTIAFDADRQQPFREGRLRVLLVSPFLPFPLSHGGAVRIFNLCRELADRVDFILVAVREVHDVVNYDVLRQVFRQVFTVDMDEHESSDRALPQQVRAAQSASLRALIADLAERLQPDLLQIEFTHMAGYRDSAPNVPALLVEHDLTLKLYEQLAHSEPSEAAREEYRRWLNFERHWLKTYDAVWTMSPQDRREAILTGSKADQTFVVANGVDTARFTEMQSPDGEPTRQQAPEVFYVGSFRHLPNILGFQKLCTEVMPRVWEQVPEARLRVVAGANHEFFWNKLMTGRDPGTDSRIEIHGFVEDLRPLYQRATVVVVPLEVSAGTNIKVLEAMACGKAVVTTPVGCAGLDLADDRDVFIRGDWNQFAAAICETLLSSSLRARVGGQARTTVEERFRWSAIAGDAYRSYQQIVEHGRSGTAPGRVERLVA